MSCVVLVSFAIALPQILSSACELSIELSELSFAMLS